MNLKRISFISVALMLVVLTATFIVSALKPDDVARWISDDGYYAVAVSRNVSEGKGVTIDGSTLTNGFQPLFTFLSAGAFVLTSTDKLTQVRLVVALNFIFYVLTALMLGLILRNSVDARHRSAAFWLVTFVYLSSFGIYQLQFAGMETPFLLFWQALVWWYFQSNPLRTYKSVFIFGLLLGGLILARIDTVFLVAILCLHLLTEKNLNFNFRLRRTFLTGCVAALVSLPWWLYNFLYFGSLIPSGGKAQQRWAFSVERIRFAAVSVLSDLVPAIHDFRGVTLIRAALVFLALIFIWKRRGPIGGLLYGGADSDSHARRTLRFGLCLTAFALALVAWYTLSSFATWHYSRYFAPLFLPGALLIACLLLKASERLPETLVKAAMLAGALWPAWMLYTHSPPLPNEMFEQLALVEKFVPAEEYVGASQSGTLGFFRERVVNLDGKVNAEALQYHPWGPEQCTLWQYLEARRIKWFCDWPTFALRNLGEPPEAHGWKLVGTSNAFALYYNPR